MMHTLSSTLVVGPVEFVSPWWLWLLPVFAVLSWWIGRRSLAGLGPITRWVALAARIIVLALFIGALAEPRWRRESQDVAVTFVLDASQSVPGALQERVERFMEDAARESPGADRGLLGMVTAAKNAYVQSLPSKANRLLEKNFIGFTDQTDLASAVQLALAVMPRDAANRIVLATDGNETAGSLLQAAEAAKAANVPIDVLPLRYKYEEEVLVDRVVVPPNARMGENVNVKVVIQANRPTRGRLSLLLNNEIIDLDPSSESNSIGVELAQGLNVKFVPVTMSRHGAQNFRAVFEPDVVDGKTVGDVVAENNQATAVSFVSGEGRVLILANDPRDAAYLDQALRAARLEVTVAGPDGLPSTLAELSGYDAIVLINQSAYAMSVAQQEELKRYVHDAGGGLVMLGGPESFGAGGWIGSPIEDALPVRLDPPQKRQMPRGALAMVIHSCEIPDGRFLGKKVCEAAVNALSARDLAGIVEYDFGSGTDWVHPLSPIGDGGRIKQSINNLQFGDMPDFAPSLEVALKGLTSVEAGQRHVIMISDGDPSFPSNALLQKYIDAKISISTVGVWPHSGSDTSKMSEISRRTGGKHYHIDTQAALATLPQIFIKEAQTVRRSLIWEGQPFVPASAGIASETFKGIGSVPPISGYVVTAEREGLSLVTLRGKENDPILAQWQYGLGRSVAFTSDVTNRWGNAWLAWPQFRAFWEQHIRWAMRPGGSANVHITTEQQGDQALIVAEAVDNKGERLNFANFKGRVALPDGTAQDVELVQVGPGRYEGRVRSDQAGTSIVSLRYAAPGDGGTRLEGNVQAAINRPFSDEYRVLEDNAALLEQVRQMTGGRVIGTDAAKTELWSHDGLPTPVQTRPFWPWMLAIGMGAFLTDVGVRRVRIDLLAIARYIRRGAAKGEVAASRSDALRTAREQAAKRMNTGVASREPSDAAEPARPIVTSEAAQAAAGAKFEAPKDAKASPTPKVEGAKPAGSADSANQPRSAKQDAAESMSALLKAKRRARDEMSDDPPNQ